MSTMPPDVLAPARLLVGRADAVMAAALHAAAVVMHRGETIDEHQVHAERVAYLATQIRAAGDLVAYAERLAAAGHADALQERMALAYAAEVVHTLRSLIEAAWSDFGLSDSDVAPLLAQDVRDAVRTGLDEAFLRAIGRDVIAIGGLNNIDLEDDVASLTRDVARRFAREEVAPYAQEIHRQDLIIPDRMLERFCEQGFFGSSIPEEYGGSGMGDLSMVIITEELSVASLAAAGSLATRPEILAKALVAGGTEEQRHEWLPKIASGEALVAVAVTEPDFGSDVASIITRAVPAEHAGVRGWRISGAKAWSTFAGRANLLALLARTNPDASLGGRGLSLFMIEKPPYPGHHWRFEQPKGGIMEGTANPTPGYRGMHSFTIALDNVFVPHTHLVGGDAGIDRGFYLQMECFAAGRLQTGGRACGLAQASLENACAYVAQRQQFGQPLADFQLTQHKVGVMATHIAAARQLTYAAARAFTTRAVAPSMAKLLACDIAGEVSREAQLLHGGWGYSEEEPVSRYVLDALVLPIFEGAKPILELRVIARGLLASIEV